MKYGYLEPNDLRIGNYVNADDSVNFKHVPIRITAITPTFLTGIAHVINLPVSGISIHSVKPVPLTEDLLLKCGFEAIDYGDKYDPDDEFAGYFEYHLNIGIFYRNLICKPSGGWYCYVQDVDMIEGNNIKTKNIYYLHELQNLYFALTGKELEVKL